jgi:ADP-heptose:LPS heptosyltransferase
MIGIAIGLASGLGNAVFMLPTIKALKEQGNHIALFVQTDFPTEDLWRRCIYADEVIEAPASTNGHRLMCGQWRPAAWNSQKAVMRIQQHYPYTVPEWKSNLQLAGRTERVGVSDWCAGVERDSAYDVGIVPGSKGGVWLRKRWPGMKQVAEHYLAQGKRVAVFGLEADGVAEIPGAGVGTANIATLPDALAQCRVIVGTDSGVTHLAASLGIPTVIVFTATSEIKGDPVSTLSRKIIAPMLCRPCQSIPRWQACHNWKCQEIPIEAVISAADELQQTGERI